MDSDSPAYWFPSLESLPVMAALKIRMGFFILTKSNLFEYERNSHGLSYYYANVAKSKILELDSLIVKRDMLHKFIY